MDWDIPQVADYLNRFGYDWARFKEPRGWKSLVTREFGSLRKHCFRNSLYVALNSGGQLWYCEGLASLTVKGVTAWYPHAWCSPKVFVRQDDSEIENDDWAFDLTWPWSPRREVFDPEISRYVGIRFDPHVANDFLHDYLPYQGIVGVKRSLLRYVDYLPVFVSGLH